MVDSSETLERIRTRHPGVQRAPDNLNDTARSWIIPGYKGSFGLISSMSDHFCGTCNRLRLTADGQIKACSAEYAIVTLYSMSVFLRCVFSTPMRSLSATNSEPARQTKSFQKR
jgi:molybdenum cofactor biosynthesis enzyme MoaA